MSTSVDLNKPIILVLMEINKILVPIDFSNCAINALKIAVKIAHEHKASLEIVNAYHSPSMHTHAMAAGVLVQPFVEEFEDVIQEEPFEVLLEEVPELRYVSYKIRKIKASVIDVIYTSIIKGNIDLIVMGTHDTHTPLERLVGSLSANVIDFSLVPVLVIPESITAMDIKKIGFAVDLRKINDITKLEVLIELGKVTGAKIEVFHISQKDDVEHITENAQERIKLLDALADVNHSYVWVNEEDILQGIFDFVENRNVDLLAMYPRHHSIWDSLIRGSLTKKVILNSQIPILTMHE